jgi:rare lipoprotein A
VRPRSKERSFESPLSFLRLPIILLCPFLLFLPLAFLTSCAPVRRPPVLPSAKAPTYQEAGYASWYGKEFHGRPTSSGEIYDMHALTAAHRTLPLGTVAEVTHAENGRSVRVTINDRGPFVDGRIIDLSYGAANQIDMADQGVAWVRVVAWPRQADLSSRRFTVQVGSFLIEENAKRFRERMERAGPVSISVCRTNGGTYYRVRVGDFRDEKGAEDLAKKLKKEGLSPLVICAD